jgi:hypothetical protein
MPIFVGGSEIKDIKIGNTEINEVYVGSTKVWERALSFVITNDYSNVTTTLSQNSSVTTTWAGYAFLTNLYTYLSESDISPQTPNFDISTYTGSTPWLYQFNHYKSEQNNTGLTPVDQVQLWVNHGQDESVSNDGWTSVTVGSTTLNRVDATYSDYPQLTVWTWTSVGNPFGTTVGGSVDVKFT